MMNAWQRHENKALWQAPKEMKSPKQACTPILRCFLIFLPKCNGNDALISKQRWGKLNIPMWRTQSWVRSFDHLQNQLQANQTLQCKTCKSVVWTHKTSRKHVGGDLKVLIQVITFWTGHPNSGNRSKNWSMGWHQGEDCRAREVTSSVKGQHPERGKCLQTLHPKWLIYITCKELKGVNDNNISHTWCNLKMIK